MQVLVFSKTVEQYSTLKETLIDWLLNSIMKENGHLFAL